MLLSTHYQKHLSDSEGYSQRALCTFITQQNSLKRKYIHLMNRLQSEVKS